MPGLGPGMTRRARIVRYLKLLFRVGPTTADAVTR